MCNEGGFNLTKFVSNSKKVLHSIAETFRRNGVKDKDLGCKLPDEQALGILWNVETDTLGFKIAIKEKPLTRRGMLSTLSSIYDPLGLGALFLHKGKEIIQALCAQNFRWDDQVPQDIGNDWKIWSNQLNQLKNLHISWHFKPPKFGRIKKTNIHHFSDASDSGYGQASYLHLVRETGRINCCLLTGKVHVTPIKYTTIPRMELVAATLSVKVSRLLPKELQLLNVKETFWTDSEVVLGYIQNESRKFKVFVANRIEIIRDHTEIHQWHYIGTKDNPADYSSRGIDVANDQAVQKWFWGPSFEWKPEAEWAIQDNIATILQDDLEIQICLQINCMSSGEMTSWRLLRAGYLVGTKWRELLQWCWGTKSS